MRITGISLIINTISTWVIMIRLKKITDKINKMENKSEIVEVKE